MNFLSYSVLLNFLTVFQPLESIKAKRRIESATLLQTEADDAFRKYLLKRDSACYISFTDVFRRSELQLLPSHSIQLALPWFRRLDAACLLRNLGLQSWATSCDFLGRPTRTGTGASTRVPSGFPC
jgi:hypothetical protein